MLDDLVAVAAAAARSLAQLGRRRGGHAIEDGPGRLDERGQPLGLGGVDRPAVEVGDRGRDAEVGAAVARDRLDDLEVDRAGKGSAGRLGDDRVARAPASSAACASSSSLPLRHQPGQSSAQAKAFFVPRSTPISSRPVAVMPLPYRHGHHRCPHPHVHAALARAAARVRAARTASACGPTAARRSSAARRRSCFPQPGHFDYGLRIATMDEAGIDVSIVSLTCPNVYWGGEAVSTDAARESNDSMAEAQRAYPDRIRWFASLPWQYPAARGRGARPELRRGRGRRHGPGQRRRPQPDRGRVRAHLGRDRPARRCPCSSIRASRPART